MNIQIETAVNGFIAREREHTMQALVIEPHVFESFDALTKWLRQLLAPGELQAINDPINDDKPKPKIVGIGSGEEVYRC